MKYKDVDNSTFETVVILNAKTESDLDFLIKDHVGKYGAVSFVELKDPEEMTVEMWGSNTFEDMEN